jgi:hypothetical protein
MLHVRVEVTFLGPITELPEYSQAKNFLHIIFGTGLIGDLSDHSGSNKPGLQQTLRR